MGSTAASAARTAGPAGTGRRRRVITGVGAAALAAAALAARRARRARRVTAYVVSGRIGVPGLVTPIRTATNTAGPPVPVGNEPFGIAITPNGKTAYVTGGTDSVTPIRTATNTAGPDPTETPPGRRSPSGSPRMPSRSPDQATYPARRPSDPGQNASPEGPSPVTDDSR